jgi:hypothetical protein
MASQMFGWELNYKLVEKDITKEEDVLVALIHSYFIKFGLRCLGLGDSVSRYVVYIVEQFTSSVG